MSKWYEVIISCFKTVVIEVADETNNDKVGDMALFEVFNDGGETNIEEITELNNDLQIKNAKNCADEVIPL